MQHSAVVVHQRISVCVNKAEKSLQGVTELQVVWPEPLHQQLGLHSLGLKVTRVLVEGQPAEFSQREYAGDEISEAAFTNFTAPGRDPLKELSEWAYFQYAARVRNEQDPELFISFPSASASHASTAGVDEEGSKAEPMQIDPPTATRAGAVGAQLGLATPPGKSAVPSTADQPLSQGTGSQLGQEAGALKPADDAVQPDSQVVAGSQPMPASQNPITPPNRIRIETDRIPDTEEQQAGFGKSSQQGAAASSPSVYTIKIFYEKRGSDSTTNFFEDFMYVDPQLLRARAWFPCVDSPTSLHTFELLVAADPGDVVVASGTLLDTGASSPLLAGCPQRPGQRVFHYRVSVPTNPSQIMLAIGPFHVIPDAALHAKQPGTAEGRDDASLLHYVPPRLAHQARGTMRCLRQYMQTNRAHLISRYPFSPLRVAWIPQEHMATSALMGPGALLLSTSLLTDERAVEQRMESLVQLAYIFARLWYGVVVLPRTPNDEWAVEGLAGHLADVFLRKLLGSNEVAYRRAKEREAVFLADDGAAPPLSPHPPQGFNNPNFGKLYGTERLEPSQLRHWKAVAVMYMLEQKTGKENFTKTLERQVTSAVAALNQQTSGAGREPGAASGKGIASTRFLATTKFLNAIGQAGDFKKELPAFAERWIHGRGCPQLTVAFSYEQKKGSSKLQLAIRQAGSEAARRAALRATEAGLLRVMVHETDGPVDHHVRLLPDDALALHELKVDSKLGARKPGGKRGQRKAGKQEDAEEMDGGGDDERRATEAETGLRAPVLWVAVDPLGEWLANVRVLQPEVMWMKQLTSSKDVVAQSAAVTGLASLETTTGVISGLAAALHNSGLFCRVRCEAALALGATASELNNLQGLDTLLKFQHERCWDPVLGLRAHVFTDLAELLVNQAVPLAIARVRDAMGVTPQEAVAPLLHVLEHADQHANPLDASNYLAAFATALGCVRVQSAALLSRMLRSLDRLLAREAVIASYHHVVGCACLTAITNLALGLATDADLIPELQQLLISYTGRGVPQELRRSAYQCLLQVEARTQGLEASLRRLLTLLEGEPLPILRLQLMQDALGLVAQHSTRPGKPVKGVSLDTAQKVVGLMSHHKDVRLRQLGFMLLQRLAGQPATLYREMEEEELGGADQKEPSGSYRTGARPAKTGSYRTGTMQAPSGFRLGGGLKLKLGKALSTGPAPSQSHGVSAGRAPSHVSGGAGGGPQPSGSQGQQLRANSQAVGSAGAAPPSPSVEQTGAMSREVEMEVEGPRAAEPPHSQVVKEEDAEQLQRVASQRAAWPPSSPPRDPRVGLVVRRQSMTPDGTSLPSASTGTPSTLPSPAPPPAAVKKLVVKLGTKRPLPVDQPAGPAVANAQPPLTIPHQAAARQAPEPPQPSQRPPTIPHPAAAREPPQPSQPPTMELDLPPLQAQAEQPTDGAAAPMAKRFKFKIVRKLDQAAPAATPEPMPEVPAPLPPPPAIAGAGAAEPEKAKPKLKIKFGKK